MSNCLQPCGLQPARLLPPWDSPGKNTGLGSHFRLQGAFPTQGSPVSPALSGRFTTGLWFFSLENTNRYIENKQMKNGEFPWWLRIWW